MGYQPPLTHPVFFNGTALNTQNWQTGTDGVAITRIEGWFDAPDVRDVRESNPGRDGELADNLYLGGRTITIEGVVTGSSYADLQTKKTALTAKLIPSSSEYVLKLPLPTNASPSWTHADSMADFERVTARVVEGVQFGDNDGPLLQSWVVVLRASDPLVYSDTLTTVDSGTSGTAARTAAVSNTGTYPSPGQIVVTGPTGTAWEVYDSDGDTMLQFASFALASSQYTTIDIRDRTIETTGDYQDTRLSFSSTAALWMLAETSGTTADNAEGTAALDGTYTGGYTLNQAGPAAGLASVDLNGTTGYIAVAYSAGLWWDSSDDEKVFEFWVYPDVISGTQTIFDSISGNTGLRLQINSSGQIVQTRGTGTGTSTLTLTTTPLVAGTWTHLVYRSAEGTVQLYVDGVAEYYTYNDKASPGPGRTAPPTATGFRIGSVLAGGSYFNGKIGPVFYAYGDRGSDNFTNIVDVVNTSTTNSGRVGSYEKLDFGTAQISSIDTGSTTYTLQSPGGLNTGSKLSIQYRAARL